MNVQKMPVKEAMSKVENADSIIDELIGHIFTEGQFLNMATKGWSDLSEEDKDEIENILSEPFKKDFVEWVSEKPFVYDGATLLHDMEEQLEEYLETALNRFLEFVWDEYAEEAQTLVDELIGMKESRRHHGRMLRESFLGNRKRGGFDASKIMRNLKDGRYDDELVISACVSALEKGQKSSLAQKLVKQLSSDGILAKVYRKSGEFGTKQ